MLPHLNWFQDCWNKLYENINGAWWRLLISSVTFHVARGRRRIPRLLGIAVWRAADDAGCRRKMVNKKIRLHLTDVYCLLYSRRRSLNHIWKFTGENVAYTSYVNTIYFLEDCRFSFFFRIDITVNIKINDKYKWLRYDFYKYKLAFYIDIKFCFEFNLIHKFEKILLTMPRTLNTGSISR